MTVSFGQEDAELVPPQTKEVVDRADASLERATDQSHGAIGGAVFAGRRDFSRVA